MAKIIRLKVMLVEIEKSGKWLADQLGKSTFTVCKWCGNTTRLDLYTLGKIANLLGVNIGYFNGIRELTRNNGIIK